jgi:molybdenum-dependent DNA-binding transcriptional regulator ModE
VTAALGGAGGDASLTPLGAEVLERYNRILGGITLVSAPRLRESADDRLSFFHRIGISIFVP